MFKLMLPFGILLLGIISCDTYGFRDGESTYKFYCAGCHVEAGTGLGELIPPLAGSDFILNNEDRLPCIIRFGLKDTIQVNGVTYAQEMEGIPSLSDVDITNLLNYINHEWGQKDKLYKLSEVRDLLSKCSQ